MRYPQGRCRPNEQDARVQRGKGHVVQRCRAQAPGQAVGACPHQSRHAAQRRGHGSRLPGLAPLLGRDHEPGRPAQGRVHGGLHVDPEAARRQGERTERVGARPGQRHRGQRSAVVGSEMDQELAGGDLGQGLQAEQEPEHGKRHVDQQRPAGQEVGGRQQVLGPDTPRQTGPEHRGDGAQAAPRPALLLRDIRSHVLRPQAGGHHL